MSNSNIHRILIVDDEEGFGKMVQGMLLNRTSFQCDISPGASEALDMLDQKEYELAISDIQMPETDGLKFMRSAKKKYPELDFIIMTAHAGGYGFSDIIDAGATDFIAKPFGWGELKAKIERIEKEKRVLQDLRSANLELAESFDRLKRVLGDSINALASALEMKDPYTSGHQQRVSDIACRIARKSDTSGQTGGLENRGPLKATGALACFILTTWIGGRITSPRQVLSPGPVL